MSASEPQAPTWREYLDMWAGTLASKEFVHEQIKTLRSEVTDTRKELHTDINALDKKVVGLHRTIWLAFGISTGVVTALLAAATAIIISRLP